MKGRRPGNGRDKKIKGLEGRPKVLYKYSV